MTKINRTHKDRLFRAIFGREEHKNWTLELYNAINNSNYTNVDDIQLTVIEDVIYMGMKNDVSFIINDTLNLYEQQSSKNPNMPLRFLEYAGMIYSKYAEDKPDFNIYSSKLQKIPTPRFVCFCNGVDKAPDRDVLKLSDAYDGEGDIEVKVLMLNINYGYNMEFLKMCRPLLDYSWFVAKVREYQETTRSIEKSVEQVISEMEETSPIKSFIVDNKAEVTYMFMTEYDEKKVMAAERKEGAFDMLIELVKKGLISISTAAQEANMSVSEFELKSGLKA
ncbi:MAG: hypothetical protein IJS61_06355 [Firmicutes bacterium]|nr:hypothetical protein [Bacillota bacterium]